MKPIQRMNASFKKNVEKFDLDNLIKNDLNARLAFAHYMPIFARSKFEFNYKVQQECRNSIKDSIILLFPQPIRKDPIFKKQIQDLTNEQIDEQMFKMPHYIYNELRKLLGIISSFSDDINSFIQKIDVRVINTNLRFNAKSQTNLINFKKEINFNINKFRKNLIN